MSSHFMSWHKKFSSSLTLSNTKLYILCNITWLIFQFVWESICVTHRVSLGMFWYLWVTLVRWPASHLNLCDLIYLLFIYNIMFWWFVSLCVVVCNVKWNVVSENPKAFTMVFLLDWFLMNIVDIYSWHFVSLFSLLFYIIIVGSDHPF